MRPIVSFNYYCDGCERVVNVSPSNRNAFLALECCDRRMRQIGLSFTDLDRLLSKGQPGADRHAWEFSIYNAQTGERRTWWIAEAGMTTIRRALAAYKSVPAYVVERFRF